MDWTYERLKSFGERTAIIEDGRSWSYRKFIELVSTRRNEISNERIVEIDTRSTVEGLAHLLAVATTSSIALPLPSGFTETELKEIRGTSAQSKLYDRLEGSGLILFSSGTSGEPKGMLHSLPSLLNRFEKVPERTDRTLQLLLIDHIGGLDAAFRCICSGSTLVIPSARTPEAAGKAIEEHKVNILPASPTFLNLMLMENVTSRFDCTSIEIIAYGAEAMPQVLLERLSKAFPQSDLQQKFGTSETGAVRIQSADKGSLFFKIKDPDTEWKITDGELWLKTPSRILGYLNADESSLEADGWYRTGDLVEEGPDDTIRIVGRESAMINVGGQKVHPSEVEAVLNEIEGVDACHVYGETDPITGQRVSCEIVSSTDRDLRSWKRLIRSQSRSKLAPWKIPAQVKIVDRLELSTRLKRSS